MYFDFTVTNTNFRIRITSNYQQGLYFTALLRLYIRCDGRVLPLLRIFLFFVKVSCFFSHRKYDNVIFLGAIKHNEVGEYLAKSWIVVAPSITTKYSAEQTCGSLLEAMSCGTAITAFDSGGISKYIINNRNGILTEEKNIKKLLEAIETLLSNYLLRKQIEKQNRIDSVGKYDVRKNIKKLEEKIIEAFDKI
ncbi:MAG: glycosyl transferase family 1 [Candidatus Berkelbacteria bacterium Licking1014_85]|uniref:Glycosyl transferase family 1 n=1 Tax=Candidatus Berkelbacteria bacterium Licking1014_85 TaxID=2017148 RepID=A0A554LJU4_9BACT|nr:MAG: glycosyl transferase family 1 [Candidatus Berkelbacteria bacterium Licking1014_85]